MAFLSNEARKLAENIMSLGGIVSKLFAFFISRFPRSFLITVSLTVLKENLSLSEISDPLTTCLFLECLNDFYKNYCVVFKIYAKSFLFSTTAFFNNIYIVTVKQFSQLFFVGDNFVFVNTCYAVISYEIFIYKKRLDEFPKALNGC